MPRDIVLSERLAAAASFVPRGSRVADVGTDHGYIPVWLVKNGVCASVIASDIGRQPLEHAKRSAEDCGAEDKIDFRLCAGLDAIRPDEADTIIIAGMGGETIASILSAAYWTRDGSHLLILQPMTKIPYLRLWLSENGYSFENEELVFENNDYFPIMTTRGGKTRKLSLAEVYGGVLLDDDALFDRSLSSTIQKLLRAERGLAEAKREGSAERLDKTRSIIAALEEKRKGLYNADCKRN